MNKIILFGILFLTGILNQALAAQKPGQSYIDQLKQEMREDGKPTVDRVGTGENQDYIDSVKKEMDEANLREGPSTGDEYIRNLRETDPKRDEIESSIGFSEREKAKLEPKPEGGAIQAVLEGHSDIKEKKLGEIHHAAGLRYGVSLNKLITAPGITVKDFNTVYGSNYAPDLSFFYEFQPFHSEWLGNFGIVAIAGLGYYRGLGQFSRTIEKPGGGTFPTSSKTQFQFISVPATLALDYRFNLIRILRPFIIMGPSFIGFAETRDDSKTGSLGFSTALMTSVGVSVLMDWMNPSGSWDLYSTFGIHHYYLTIEYNRYIALSGDVKFDVSGIMAGLAFEY